jgi:thiamine-monophosphate kinase
MAIVEKVGERELIELMIKQFTPMPNMPVPFWDDVMAFNLENDQVVVLNSDMLVWKTDVPIGMSYRQAARKAVVMNFSDLGAKGVSPEAFLASIGIPRWLKVDDVVEMARGFEEGVREYCSYVIGGDTNESEEIIISGVAVGVSNKKSIMKRDGAKPGDIIATTGKFGNTGAAYKILLEGFDPPVDLKNSLLDSIFMPKARVKEGMALSKTKSVSSSIDSSDGLALSLHDLSKSSNVGFELINLPISKESIIFAGLYDLDPKKLALYGGEEYELLFTIKPGKFRDVKKILKNIGCEVMKMGQVTSERKIILIENGVEEKIKKAGWEHFKT